MCALLFVFLIVMAVIFTGFVVGLHGLLGAHNDGFATYWGTELPLPPPHAPTISTSMNRQHAPSTQVLTLFNAALGDFDLTLESGSGATDRTLEVAAIMTLVTFLLLVMLLLLNLLIAFMAGAQPSSQGREPPYQLPDCR